MGKLYSLISALLLTVSATYAVVPDSYEWWFDDDVSAAQTGAFTGSSVDLQIDTSELPKGIHYFNMRLSAAECGAGTPFRRMFHSFGKDEAATSYIYWFDDDIAAGQSGVLSDSEAQFDIDTSTLPKGLHYFNMRLSSDEGIYGAPYRQLFHALGEDKDAITYEYWYDEDFSSRVKGDMPVGSRVLTLDISTLPQGAHYFNCRVGYGDGKWGAVYRKMVLNLAGNVNATAYEYWIDDNYDRRIHGDFAYGENTYVVDLTGVRKGLHRFHYRLRTGEGIWGAPYTSYFYSASNDSHFTHYEYWLDNDFAGRKTASATGNPVSFEVDLTAFDKSCGVHFFNLRARDDDGEWGTIYRKLLIFDNDNVPVIGYRQFINGSELDYVKVQREVTDTYMFDAILPDSLTVSVKGKRPIFEGDKVTIGATDSIDYRIQIETELGWAPPIAWKLEVGNEYSTSAVEIAVNSRHEFATPTVGEFAALKFVSPGMPLYFRTDIPIALDLYKGGERAAEVSAEQLEGMAMLDLEAGEYFGILRDAEGEAPERFTFHLMDTPNQVPMPTIVYEDETVSISCTREDAIIRYTIDGNDPDAESTLYSEPFPLKQNAVVKAKAWVEGSDIEPSAVAEYTIDTYKTAAPVAEFDLAKRLLTLTSETKDASIFYTHEYDPADSLGGVWTDYKDPIQIRKNCTVYSRATFDGYKDSNITVTEITTLPDSVPMPRIEFEKGIVTISCDQKDAEIHYTLDGNQPTAGSTLYTGAFPLRRNTTVMAMAFVPGLDIDTSRVATRVIDSYKVATPKGSFDVKTRLLTLTCDTVGASITYSFDKEGEWTAYSATERIRMRKNGTVYAKAIFDGYNDSDVAEIVVSELPNEVTPPEISCDGNGLVTMTCSTEDAVIRYSFDDEEPTMESTLYEAPFTITRNVRVNAFAYIADLDIEPSTVSSVMCDIFTVADLTYVFNMESRTLIIECATEGATILYTFDPNGDWTEYTGPISIRKNCTLYAKAVCDGYYDSKTETITINSLANSVQVPVISFNEGMVEIKCDTDKAEIHYTIDNENLTAESPKYTEPFALERNAIIRAFAFVPGLDIEPSDVVTFVVDSYKVEKPTGDFNPDTKELTITCATKDAKIFYAFDRTGEWTPYSGPISITKNCTVYAYAALDGYKDSDVAEIAITALANSVAAPTIEFTDGKVTIACTTKDAKIHYTIDDENIDVNSPEYTEPFSLNRNATIRAFAIIPGLDIEPSAVTTKVIDSFKVEPPTGTFDPQRRLLTITCGTDGATIYYAFSTEGNWTEYTSPLSITRNMTVYAKASLDGWNDSEVTPILISELAENVPAPEISFKDGTVTISCDNDDAEIHYTVDDPDLTAESPVYEGPFALDRNATIRAFALIPGLDIAPSGIETYVVDTYKVATPYGRFDAESRQLTILCDTEQSSISYSYDLDGVWQPYSTPIEIEGNRTVYAMATRDGWNDSEVADIVISDVKCADVSIDYHGRYVSLKTSETGATIRYTIDGTEPSVGTEYSGPFDVEGLCTVRAVAVKDGYMNSEVAELEITRYANDTHAETAAEGLLASAFEWDNTGLANNVTDFRIKGRLNDADYGFIRSMGALRHLDLEEVADAHLPEYAFRDSRLISISLPADIIECGDSIFSGASLLSSVVWNSTTMNVGEGLTRGIVNPNVLLYVSDEVSVDNPRDINVVMNGNAVSVTLRYGFPYYAVRDFHADEVSLTHDFRQTTLPEICRGWETIVLPFSPTKIMHETNGPIVPFAALEDNTEDAKPFWLYSATATGWEASKAIEACVPYIISMPNNPDYVDEYNLGGKVTFSAKDVILGPSNSLAKSDPWINGYKFEGTFMPMEEIGMQVHSLNVGSTEGGYEPGSKFLPDGTTLPFGAYVSGAPARMAIPLFGEESSVDLPLTVETGLLIETPAPGVLRICSGRERKVTVTTATGVTIRTLHLKPGEAATLEGLTRDLYIVAGRKVMVR